MVNTSSDGRSGCGPSGGSQSDEGRRHRGPSRDACRREQLATTEFEVESVVLYGHGGEVAPRVAAHFTTIGEPSMSVRHELFRSGCIERSGLLIGEHVYALQSRAGMTTW
jgi:hypothetical protein